MFELTYLLVINILHCNGASADPQFPPGRKLVIDHDGGADDAMAIFMALLYEKYLNGWRYRRIFFNLLSITSIVINNTSFIVFDVPIYRGSERSLVISVPSDYFFGKDGLGDLENVEYQAIPAENLQAAIALIELSKKYAGELTIMAIGSLTNIAMAIRLDPQFIGRLLHLYVGAGHIYSEQQHKPEFNAEMDVEAYHMVAEGATPDKVTIMAFSQVMQSINISLEWRINDLGGIPTKIMQAQNDFERLSLAVSEHWYILDPVVAAATLDNNIITEVRNSENSIILCGDQRGINTNNFMSATPNTKIAYAYNSEYYQDLLIKTFSAEIK
ncbi:hypothetical protein K1T71_003493 [Dendrolimus kikuchii]|uniref:Uncharacterized protein n=1 Tax=Dendrolimus kikuchii TaxID=765133 RepID=A0ACC1DCR7_9NEOP|nr:hypothetical protein K1T71_003493 [Dendrolimus kikuchii]